MANNVNKEEPRQEKEEEPCKYCGALTKEKHMGCLEDYETRKANKLCVFCGLDLYAHDDVDKDEKDKPCERYANYGIAKIFIGKCEMCNTPVHPNFGTKDKHDVCTEEENRRKRNNRCTVCNLELLRATYKIWNRHDDCSLRDYVGYKPPVQNMDLKVGYYSETTFRISKSVNLMFDSKTSKFKDVDESGKNEILPFIYDEISGMDDKIQQLKEAVEFPLINYDKFKEAGIQPPKGVLLHGPTGCGKTHIANMLSKQTGVHFIYIPATTLHSMWAGNTEQKIREVFSEAINNEPSIIFMDELDSLGKNRDDVNMRSWEADQTMQLLSSLDEIKDRRVIFIGATNNPSNIDPSLRRPGRLDVEIMIGMPNQKDRLHILKQKTAKMKLARDLSLEFIAANTNGFTCADLTSLVTTSGMRAVKRSTKNKARVTNDDFKAAITKTKPSILRNTDRNISIIKWDDIGGLAQIKDSIYEDIKLPKKYNKLYEKMKINISNGILLHGKPGTGKTMIAKAIATDTSSNFITVGCADLLSSLVGETEKNIKEVFEKARKASPCVLFMDEIDSIIPARNSNINDNRIVSQILIELDGAVTSDGVILIGATNALKLIDKAVLRPGRFDKIIEITPPDYAERVEILKLYVEKRPHAKHINFETLAKMIDNCTGADIAYIVNKASMMVLKTHIDDGVKNNQDEENIQLILTEDVIIKAINEFLSR